MTTKPKRPRVAGFVNEYADGKWGHFSTDRETAKSLAAGVKFGFGVKLRRIVRVVEQDNRLTRLLRELVLVWDDPRFVPQDEDAVIEKLVKHLKGGWR